MRHRALVPVAGDGMRRAAAAARLLALTACTGGGGGDGDRSREPLPPIATDPCPAAGELLAQPAPDGDRLPDVRLRCLGHDGEVPMRLLGGKPYVVNLWASWCIPCRTEMPAFQQVRRALGGRAGFLGVNTKDREASARSTIQDTGISYPSVFDEGERIRRHVNARSLPATLFVSAEGRIENVHVGELTATELRALIGKHLGVS